MGFFRRRPSLEQVRARQDEGIAAFWAWWLAEGRAQAAATFDGEDGEAVRRLGPVLAEHVHAVDPDLSFETGSGRAARHVLTVTAAGNPDLRDVARRWLDAAPAADDAFEYADFRRPVADPSGIAIGLDEHRTVDLASATVVAVVEGGKVHVQVSHPEFAALPDDAQGQITFLLLDALLGEEAVERWVGEVAWAPAHGVPPVPLLELPALVDGVRGPA
ncbi:hypothetical protein [Cellulomonas cellasea]|uniref:DUF695 domain-containing protein n=2 Tax=Cellulomonas cellasea TaxID=43670 RepID=A0A0A0BAB8_9CELL|nr:hypothetical protein [Cellulomonas cellasea]KGM02789.1 hypothetical protein Q760_11265 [Cellulomonas cellasea DSM 20118]GEA87635.1 hypothetical protein CCE01nite_15840 [Cellulomonas cellasea]